MSFRRRELLSAGTAIRTRCDGERRAAKKVNRAVLALENEGFTIHNRRWRVACFLVEGRAMLRWLPKECAGRRERLRVLGKFLAAALFIAPQILFAQQISPADEAKLRSLMRERDGLFRSGDVQEAYRRAGDVLKYSQTLAGQDVLVADSQVRLAMIAEKLDRPEEAAGLYSVACPVFVAKASGRDPRPALCQHAWAMVLLALGRSDEARPIYESALAGLTKILPATDAATATYALAERLRDKSVDDEAIKYFDRAADMYLATSPKRSDFASSSLEQLAGLQEKRGRAKEAAAAIRRLIELPSEETTPNPAKAVSWKFQLAVTLAAAGEFDEALALLQEVKQALASAAGPTHIGPEAVLSRIAGLQLRVGATDAAMSTVDDIVAIVSHKPPAERRTAYVDFGLSLLDDAEINKNYPPLRPFIDRIGGFDGRLYDEWKSQTATAEELRDLLGVLPNRIAIFQVNRSEFVAARKGLMQSLTRVREVFGPDSDREMAILMRLGAQALAQQDPYTAKDWLDRAIAIAEKRPGKDHELYYVYALVLRRLGPADIAEQAMDRALKMQEDEERLSAGVLMRRSQQLAEKGDFHTARLTAELAYLEDQSSPALVSELADLYEKEKDWPKATEFAEGAVTLRTARYGSSHMNTAASRFSLGRIYLETGRPKDALTQFEECGTIMSGVVGDFEAELATAEFQLTIPPLIDSWRSALLSMSDQYQDKAALYDRIAGSKGAIEDVLRRRYSALRSDGIPGAKALLVRLDSARSRLGYWLQRQAVTESGLWQSKLRDLISEKEEIERGLAELEGSRPRTSITPNSSGVSANLAESEVFVDIFKYGLFGETGDEKDQYAAFVIRKGGTVDLIKLGRASEIDAAVRQWRASIDQESRAGWRFLRNLAWVPMESALAGAKIVWVSPDGQLSAIPWQLFPADNDNSGTFAASPSVLQVNSAREFMRRLDGSGSPASAPEAKQPILIVGGLDYGPAATAAKSDGECWDPLPETQVEAELIDDLSTSAGYVPTMVRGRTATKAGVSQLLESSALAHLATHGFSSPEIAKNLSGCKFRKDLPATGGVEPGASSRIPFSRSGLVLSGANAGASEEAQSPYLTADDLLGLRLDGLKMIVLSACETGLGDSIAGQGVLGLRTAIAASGAKVLIMSLWDVPDAAPTRELMRQFYAGLWQQHLPIPAALLAAQTKVASDPAYKAPKNWAGWIVVGQ
jgi:tetratricopeptide (TPR) repeat protein